MLARTYQWTTNRDDRADDAVTVGIGSDAAALEAIGLPPGEPSASICWPNRYLAGDLVKSGGEGPYAVSDALERAEQLRARWAFARVVISLQHRSLWQEDWGTLCEFEGLQP